MKKNNLKFILLLFIAITIQGCGKPHIKMHKVSEHIGHTYYPNIYLEEISIDFKKITMTQKK